MPDTTFPFIRGVSYDEPKKQLTVRFSTSTYVYHDVPPESGRALTHFAMQNSEIEDAFNAEIEGKFRSTREV